MKSFAKKSTRWLVLAATLAAVALPLQAAPAGPVDCSADEARSAQDSKLSGRSLQRIRLQYKRYAQCDDGVVAERFGTAITVMLADHWGEVRKHGGLLQKDASFRDFLVRHVNPKVPEERLARIVGNATDRCPDRLASFCRDILAAAK